MNLPTDTLANSLITLFDTCSKLLLPPSYKFIKVVGGRHDKMGRYAYITIQNTYTNCRYKLRINNYFKKRPSTWKTM